MWGNEGIAIQQIEGWIGPEVMSKKFRDFTSQFFWVRRKCIR